jgi:hypothetical protein
MNDPNRYVAPETGAPKDADGAVSRRISQVVAVVASSRRTGRTPRF